MSELPDEKLDAMLRSRRLEASSPDLANRIILKAQSIPQNQTFSFMQWLRQLFTEFHLAPAYVLAGTLILGFIVGFNTPLGTGDRADAVYVQSFLYADEDVL
jgi:hypothetical protein